MNRRNFITSSAAVLALAGGPAMAQRASKATTLTSELTGASIDISKTGLTFTEQHIDDADGSEHFHFATEAGGRFDVYLWPVASMPSRDLTYANVDMTLSLLGGEIVGQDDYDDGGWVAMYTSSLKYFEYQIGAYPGHDLITFIWNEYDEFDYIFEEAQKIMVDGGPPMLFTEDSDILAISAQYPPATTESTAATSGRSSRGNSDSSETSGTRKSRNASSSEEDSSDDGGNAVEQVRQHQNDFWASYDDLGVQLKIYSNDAATKQEKDDAFLIMLNIGTSWQNATVWAKDVVFSADEAELESLYLDWADSQRELGFALEGVLIGSGDVATYSDAEAAFAEIDSELTALLNRTSGMSARNKCAILRDNFPGCRVNKKKKE